MSAATAAVPGASPVRTLLGRNAPPPINPADLVPGSPFRRPDWRWRRAELLHQLKTRPSRRRDDELVQACWKFQQRQQTWSGPAGLFRLLESWPHLYQAWNVEQHANARVRCELQARLLSGQSLPDIAQRLSLHLEDVRWYGRVFFQIEDRLAAQGYIVNVVFGDNFVRMREGDYATLWKYFGYFGGPVLLDVIINRTPGMARPSAHVEATSCLTDDTKQALLLQANVAARTLNVNPFNQLQVLELYQKYLELEKLAGSSSSTEQFMDGVRSLVKGLQPLWSKHDLKAQLPATEERVIPIVLEGMATPSFPAPAAQATETEAHA